MPQQKPTTGLLKQLRALMQNVKYVKEPLSAYIVPSCDAHHSEYLAEADRRRAFISGFTGSAGTAIITHQHACLWTDGRYFLQATQEMDENWTLMKEGVPTTLTQGTWLVKTLPTNSRVGVDPKLITHNAWVPLQTQLQAAGHKLVPITTNLIDALWTDRPTLPNNPVKPLQLKYTGKNISEKLEAIREQMKEKNVNVLVLTALDEIAWTLNLRGSDIPYNPVFFAYVIVFMDTLVLFMDKEKITVEVDEHLRQDLLNNSFKIEPYETIFETFSTKIEKINGNIWLSDTANYALTSLVPSQSLVSEITPVTLMKAVKNPVEINGMINSHIKDAAALCCYFSWLEKEVPKGGVTEVSGAKKLNDFRKLQEDFVGDSFTTISSIGPNGAIIHYQPDESSDMPLTIDQLYLCDSGGQYKDGTTDVTRTLHFGTPTEYEKECFTRVLKGQINLATRVFPSKIKGNCLDSFARQYLWDVGLDYAHGTGHGIGSYLNVHEGPMGISWRHIPDDPGLVAGMFLSNEPGYYENGKFGIRLEDIVQTVPADAPNNFQDRGFLTFNTITLLPKQIKMINVGMLTKGEISYLNAYHKKCRDIIGPVLEKQGEAEAKAWLWKETEPIVA